MDTCPFNTLCDEKGKMSKTLVHMGLWWLSWGKALLWLSDRVNWPFFHGTQFLLENMSERRTTVIQTWVFARYLFKNELFFTSRKITLFVASNKVWSFKQNSVAFWKNCFWPYESASFPLIKEFSNEISGDIYCWEKEKKLRYELTGQVYSTTNWRDHSGPSD